MITYLSIGIMVELLIIAIRTLRGVAPWNDVNGWVILGVVVIGLFNALIWPITIVSEVINTIKGV